MNKIEDPSSEGRREGGGGRKGEGRGKGGRRREGGGGIIIGKVALGIRLFFPCDWKCSHLPWVGGLASQSRYNGLEVKGSHEVGGAW